MTLEREPIADGFSSTSMPMKMEFVTLICLKVICSAFLTDCLEDSGFIRKHGERASQLASTSTHLTEHLVLLEALSLDRLRLCSCS